MRVTLHKDSVHSVSIEGDFTGPYINLEISPEVAYELLKALDKHREALRDMAENYYDCKECGDTHHKDVKVCPNISQY